jgi:exopolysaccharide biosynthesis predicted pyruvyltransferase EpsI
MRSLMDKFEETLLEHKNDRFMFIHPIGGKGDELQVMGMTKKLRSFGIDFSFVKYKKLGELWFAPLYLKMAKTAQNEQKMRSSAPSGLNNAEASQFKAKTKNTIYSLTKNILYKKMSKTPKYEVVLLRGGGYLNDIWNDFDVLEVAIKSGAPNIIIGPHSFSYTEHFCDLIASTNQEIDIFCREQYSFELISSLNFHSNVHIYKSPDPAFYLSPDDFLPKDGYDPISNSYDYVCTRKDRESAVDWNNSMLQQISDIRRRQPNGKPRKLLIGDIEDVQNFRAFANIILGANSVFSDRLHTAILAAILGKNTYLFPISYRKNQGIYEYNLGNFSNVKFMGPLKTVAPTN